MATIKINTWISSRRADITEDGNKFAFGVKPFKMFWEGVEKEIRYIRFEENNDNINSYQNLAPDITQDISWSHGRISLDLEGTKIKIVDNDVLSIIGKVPANTWNWVSDFRFTLTGTSDWDNFDGSISGSKGLTLNIQERTVDPSVTFSPSIKKIIINCGEYDEGITNRTNLKNSLVVGKEYLLDMTALNTTRAKMLTDNRLNLNNPDYSIPTISPVGTNNQTNNQNQVKSKVQEAYNQAQTAYNNRRTNLEGAIKALKELLKIGKEGTTEEKNELASLIYELENWKTELVHNCYEQGKSIPNWEGENDTPPPPKEGDDTPTLWEQEIAQPGFIERYNELYRGGKHSVLVKFSELHSQIHDNFEKYKDKPLFKQMDEKEATFREFRSIWDKDDKTKRLAVKNFNEAELAKREEVIKLMEQLLAENQGDSSDNSKKRKNDDQSDSSNKKPKTVSEIKAEAQNEVQKHDKVIQNTLADLITEAQGKNTYAELEPLLKEIDKYKGEKSYSEKDSEITELKKRLIKLDSKKYQLGVSFGLKNELEKNGIAPSDLDSETQSLLTKLEKEMVNEEEVIQAEKKVSEAIGVKNMLNKLDKLIQELETARRNKDNKKGEAKLQELVRFTESTNLYQQKAYQQKKSSVDSLLKGESSQGSPSKDGGFAWTPVLVIGGVLVVGIVGVLVFRSRKRKKEKEEVL